jgi:hypothetical protein
MVGAGAAELAKGDGLAAGFGQEVAAVAEGLGYSGSGVLGWVRLYRAGGRVI